MDGMPITLGWVNMYFLQRLYSRFIHFQLRTAEFEYQGFSRDRLPNRNNDRP